MIYERPLLDFIRESNRIEGLHHDPERDLLAHQRLLDGPLGIGSVQEFVSAVQPGAELRSRQGLNVRVGRHIAPPGGKAIKDALDNFLSRMQTPGCIKPWDAHVEYETLHPFTDGNGRSGRALWLWQMIEEFNYDGALGFLHLFYYQTLDRSRVG